MEVVLNFFHPIICVIKVMITYRVCSICLSAYVHSDKFICKCL